MLLYKGRFLLQVTCHLLAMHSLVCLWLASICWLGQLKLVTCEHEPVTCKKAAAYIKRKRKPEYESNTVTHIILKYYGVLGHRNSMRYTAPADSKDRIL